MKKRTHILRIAVLVSVCLLLISQPLLAEQTPADGDAPKTVYTEYTGDSTAYVPICTNGGYMLSFYKDGMLFRIEPENAEAAPEAQVVNEETEETVQPTLPNGWYSAMTQETYSRLNKSSKTWKAYLQSLLSITYIARADTRGNVMRAYSGSSNVQTDVKVSENGLQFQIHFSSLKITINMEVSLEKGRLVVRIPAADIREEGEFALQSIEPLPFFGAISKEMNADGYLVYPDGSGAITYFDRVDDKNAFTQPIELAIYDTLNLEQTLSLDKSATAMLPIYGIKGNDKAVLAAITDGGENAKIVVNAAIENSAVPIHRSSFELYYRNEYRIFLSSITGANSANEQKTDNFGVKYDVDLQMEDREITYFLLEDEDANYSGMANAYRDYLLETGELKDNKLNGGLFLNLFMGMEKEDAMVNPFVTMTTYEEVQEICSKLLDGGVENLDVMLRGWSKGGYASYPQSFKAAGGLGGNGGLKDLNAFAKNNEEVSISLETELVHTNKNNYIAVKGTNLPITDKLETQYVLSPVRVNNQFEKARKAIKKYDSLTMALPTLGSSLYPDYDDARAATRFDTADIWKNVVGNDNVAATGGGNLYVLSTATHLYDMPESSSMQQMTDRSIPWYYMIVHGSVSYSTRAGNRTGDLNMLKLQWIECGASPYFELTGESPIELFNTEYNDLFSSEFTQWEERVLTVTKELQKALDPVADVEMIKHEYIGDEQVCVTYENGYRIVINYGEEAFTFENTTIPSMDYLVLSSN